MDRIVRNFKIVEQIGNGTTGVVHKAIQLALDRTVALKELHGHLARDADFIRRFEREAKTAATLSHENILSVIDFGKEGDAYFIALEYVDGSDLKNLMESAPGGSGPDSPGSQTGRVPVEVATAIAISFLRGLEHAHGRGIVHRDIKPANVMISRDGVAKIADFSIAQASMLPSMTVTGAMMGTPAYMSPEQVAGRPLDARTDLFSAGIVLYEMLAGRRPFEGDSYPAIISQLLTTIPPDLSEKDSSIPPEIAAIVKRALEKDPARRFQTATEFLEALESAAQHSMMRVSRSVIAQWAKDPKEYSLSEISKSISIPRPRPQPPVAAKSNRAWLAIPAVAVIGLGAWGGRSLFSTDPAPTPAPTATPFAVATTATPVETIAATPEPTRTAVAKATPTAIARHTNRSTPKPTPTATATAVAVLPKGTARLMVVAKPWAHIYVDGVKLDTTPLANPIEIPSGRHQLKLQYSDFKPIERVIDVKPGELVDQKVDFDARVKVVSNLVAEVYLDGDHVGSTTTPFQIPPGKHTLVVKRKNCSDFPLAVNPQPGETVEKPVQLACK